MKIPEPIIDPATSMVESSKPNPRTNFCSVAAGGVAVVLSIKGLYLVAARVLSRNLRNLANGNGKGLQTKFGNQRLVNCGDGFAAPAADASLPGLIRCRVRELVFACGRSRRRCGSCRPSPA